MKLLTGSGITIKVLSIISGNGALYKPDYLAPQLSAYMNNAPDHEKILQLVIELDSITSTI